MKPVNPFLPCGSFDDDLKAYHDGELNFLKRWQVRSHLAKCPQCQEELKLMQTIEKELTSEVMAPIEPDLRAKILEGVSVENVQTTVLPPVGNTVVRNKRPKGLILEYAGLFAVIAVVGIGFLSISGNRIKNTFNAASNSLADGGEFDAEHGTPLVGASSGGGYAPESSAGAASPLNSPQASNSQSAPYDDRLKALRQSDKAENWNASRLTPYSSVQNSSAQRSVHKEGSLTVAVDNSETSGSAVETLVKRSGGFVASNALSTGVGGMRSATMDLRIPVDSFESIVSKIGALGTVRAKSINGQDVTAQVAVAGARKETLSNQLAMAQARLRDLSRKFKPGSGEVAESRAEVRTLNLQAAQAKAELDTIRKFAALSTLYVTLQDKGKAPTPASFSGSLNETGTQAWSSFLNTARLPIQLVIWILAYSPLWLPAWIIWRKFGRKLVA